MGLKRLMLMLAASIRVSVSRQRRGWPPDTGGVVGDGWVCRTAYAGRRRLVAGAVGNGSIKAKTAATGKTWGSVCAFEAV